MTDFDLRWRIHLSARGVILLAAALLIVGAVVAGWGGPWMTTAITDVSSFLAAVAAVFGCARAARGGGNSRTGWMLLAVASGLWAAGELLWTIPEVVFRDEVPFPSVADIAYLAAVPVALVALLAFVHGSGSRRRVTAGMDACLVAGSLLFVAWALVVGPLWSGSSSSSFARAVEIAYPVTDIAMATVAILVLRTSRAIDHRALHLVSAGFLVMAATDTVYTWMVNTATFASSSPVALGWPAGYLLIAAAGWTARGDQRNEPASVDSRASILLPYAPLLIAASIAVPKIVGGGDGLGPFLAFDALLLVAIVVARQGITALDLRRTVLELHDREDELHHLALHDPLTGLANRANFSAAFAKTASRPDVRAAVLYIDLDGFKQINDRFGHAVGDAMLIETSRRLAHCVTDRMLLARLGGDEFVILVDEGEQVAQDLAELVLSALTPHVSIEGDSIAISASIGVAVVPSDASEDEAIRRADAAMYIAKESGKGRAVRYPDETFVVAHLPLPG